MGYSKAPEQPQSSARPICHSHAMTSTGREPATIRIAACIRIGARRATHCATFLVHLQRIKRSIYSKEYTEITEVNLSAFAYSLFHEDFSSIVEAKCCIQFLHETACKQCR